MLTPIDRLTLLQNNSGSFTGIDFVHVVDPTVQTTLHVYFVTDPRGLLVSFTFDSSAGSLLPRHFVIHNVTDPAAPDVEVVAIDTGGFQSDELGRTFLQIQVAEPGDFAEYRLRIDDPRTNLPTTPSRIDTFFNDVKFSFKAGCDTDQDCQEPALVCPPEARPDFAVDYLARDFVSFRNALLDFAAQRYPEWTLPIEADVGVMLAEVMAALGDEFSYLQDRYAREAFLETANQRRSLRRKARLLDFEIHDGRSASTLLELAVDGDGTILPGSRVWAATEDGDPIAFEIGSGLRDTTAGFAVKRDWNAGDVGAQDATIPAGILTPYVFDLSQLCLQVGATELFIEHQSLVASDLKGRVMLLRTEPQDPSLPARRHFVHVLDVEELVDALNGNKTILRLTWDPSEALPFQLDLQTLQISFNVLPATAGETIETVFVCGPGETVDPDVGIAAEREGPLFSGSDERPTVFLFGLPQTDTGGLGFLGASLRNTLPEVVVRENVTGGNEWVFQRSLLAANAADEWFTLEDGTWRRVVAYRRAGLEIVHQDYATGAGFSIRFGDGMFGRVPPRGTEFEVRYRLGLGSRANVPAGAINRLLIPSVVPPFDGQMPAFVRSVTNPVEVTTGIDPETSRDIKLLTPEAFRNDVLFAVRPEDFSTQAEKLDFIQRAHGTPRWTGSWTSMFVAGDPIGAFTMTPQQLEQLGAWMDCVRQAGRDVVVQDPKTLPIDLTIDVCVEPFAYAAQVRAHIEDLLVGTGGGPDKKAFFDPDNFTFGMPLRRSALEAAIHGVPGVRFIRNIFIRERGVSAPRDFSELVLGVDADQVIRLDNDPLRPNFGTLQVITEGGA